MKEQFIKLNNEIKELRMLALLHPIHSSNEGLLNNYNAGYDQALKDMEELLGKKYL